MLQIRHLDHVVLRVTNLQAMMHFYMDVLGCTLEKVQENIGLWQLRAGGALIDLVPVDGAAGKKGGAAPGRGEMKIIQDGKWVGPCPADMTPGDVSMGNGMKMNIKQMPGAKQ